MPAASWMDRVTDIGPSGWPEDGSRTLAVISSRAGRPGSTRPGPARAGVIFRHRAASGSADSSGRMATVAAARRASRAITWPPIPPLKLATGYDDEEDAPVAG